MGLTPYGVIPHTDVKVGDLIEINTITVLSGKVLDVDKEMVKLSTPDGRAGYWTDASPVDFTPVSWTAMSAHDRRVVLVNRPEPPKPAAKVGTVLTTAGTYAEPPVGTIIARSTHNGTKARIRETAGWKLIAGDDVLKRVAWDIAEDIGYKLVFVPGE